MKEKCLLSDRGEGIDGRQNVFFTENIIRSCSADGRITRTKHNNVVAQLGIHSGRRAQNNSYCVPRSAGTVE